MKRRKPKRIDLGLEELGAILDRAAAGPLGASDLEKLRAAVDTLAWLTREIDRKGMSLERLRRLFFGARTETTREVLGESGSGRPREERRRERGEGQRRKGHGRNGAAAYPGAERVSVAHGSVRPGERCPDCSRGKVYPQADPAVLVRVQGMAPLRATVYELARLRCNLCGELFTAEAPEGVGTEKYDETAASMIGLLKYGTGLPFHRLARLEKGLGIPLPAATQWEVVQRAAVVLAPAYAELVRQAAQGEVLHNDDTTMRILEIEPETRAEAEAEQAQLEGERTGVFTSGIVSVAEGRQIALFLTGAKHAGENLAQVLAHRAAELEAPIQMCDALSRNTSGDLATIVANCLAHARRRYVDVADHFPEECRFVLETLREVYRTDAHARVHALGPEERLRLHQAESGPRMGALEQWMAAQLAERKVEPNSGLGEAIAYMQKHWDKLTLFLREPGAPLDNNVCERALKKAILHRKNALFYKTRNGARVGDLFMSLIHTAELCSVSPFDYLVALQRHAAAVSDDPGRWMPWSYRAALAELTPTPGPAG
jgi:hypothetical protein